ncbi:MAG: AraC family transcriptional regulator [Lachnospiraceae bacterium]
MPYYITYGEFQDHMKQHFDRTGTGIQFTEMCDILFRKGLLKETAHIPRTDFMFEGLDDDAFETVVNSLILTLEPNISSRPQVQESAIIPAARDVFVIRHPRYTRRMKHTHNYFEINYVARGSCQFFFEDTMRILETGEMCLLAPNSEHDIIIEDESTIFTIMLRKSTFDTTFFSLLSQKNLLSYFFRTILQEGSHSNYLLFFASDNVWIKKIIWNMMGESCSTDEYSNECCINWVNLLFSNLLRNYSKTLQFYDYQIGSDFSLILQYIQHNYQTLTLSALAELFHYSEPHLSTLIRQNTGYTFTDLIKRLRMADSVEYLTNTDMRISEIAEKVGYHSADHFSRTFKMNYQSSPQEYRNLHRQKQGAYNPFFIDRM